MTHFLVPVFLFQKAPPIGNTQNPTGQGTLDPSRIARVLPSRKKRLSPRFVACWQATDKALENSRLFGVTPGRSLSLASNGEHSSKKNFGNSKKNKKQNFLDFQHEKEAAADGNDGK